MKILHVIQGITPRNGGTTTSIVGSCRALNTKPGVTAEIVTTDWDGPDCRLSPASLPGDIPIHLFGHTWSASWFYSRDLATWIKGNASRYDLIHVHGLWTHSTFVATRVAYRKNVPYVVSPDGMLSSYSLRIGGSKKRIYAALAERRSLKRAAAIQATGKAESNDITRYLPGAETFVIPHGLDESAWTIPPDPGRLRERCGIGGDSGTPIFLFLGRLHPIKGIIDLLLPAIAGLKIPVHLAIAGGRDARVPGYREEVLASISRLGLTGKVSLLGEVTGEEKWAIYDGAAAFVLPSHSENFGIVVAEAMARRCPAVVTNTVNAHEHVTAAGCGAVVERDVGQLTAALTRVLSDPAERRRMGTAGATYAAERLTWSRVADELIRMYQSVIGRTGT